MKNRTKFKISFLILLLVVIIYNPISARIFAVTTALTHNLDAEIFYNMIKAESSFRSLAYSKQKAIGLAQMKGSTYKFMLPQSPRFMVWFPPTNLYASARYIKYLKKKYNQNWSVTLAAYNWGESNVDKRFKNKSIVSEQDYRERFRDVPETFSFIKNILGDAK